MENHAINVRDLGAADRAALERVIGHRLHDNAQLIIQVAGANAPASPGDATAHMPEWSDVYAGLSDEQVAEFQQESGTEPN